MSPLRARWALLGVLAAGACATALHSIGRVPEVDQSKFTHAKHKAAGIDCISCHEGVWDATDLKTSQLPNEAKCLECHKAKKEEGSCGFCHTEPKLAAAWPKREAKLNFNHVKHLERTKEDCTACHKALYEPGQDQPMTGGHTDCMSCHEHQTHLDQAQCTTCHQDLKRYGLKPVMEFSHQGDFLKRHALAARASATSCATCHEQKFCLECHATTAMAPTNVVLPDRPDRSFIHRGDFLSRHFLEAKADPASCKQCHATNFCIACHQAQNVAPGAAGTVKSPHPKEWALPFGAAKGAGAPHGDAARRDSASCAACHDQGAASNCVTCHKVGGVGGDPHPSSFGSKHTLQDANAQPMCRTCHR